MAEDEAGVLAGRVALVTGAGQGVGRGIALAMSGAGARLVLAGRTLSKCEAVQAEIEARGGVAIAVRCDVTDRADIDACVDATVSGFDTVDILVNNAQQTVRGPLLDVSDEDMAASWDSGPLATLRFMQRCHPHLVDGGVIINLGSRSGVKPDPIRVGPYAAVKEAIRVLTRTAAIEWADDGIRALAILPLSESPALTALAENAPDAYERALSSIPMGRFGDAEHDIGAVTVFLASDAARYLTGITIPIDGGAAHLR